MHFLSSKISRAGTAVALTMAASVAQAHTGHGTSGVAEGLAHPLGAPIGKVLNEQLDRLLVHLLDYYHGLQPVTPEWYCETSASASVMAAIIAQTNVWSGQVCSGPSITTLSPLSGGQNANDIIDIQANLPSPSPVHHLDKSAISMLWAFDAHRPAARCPNPAASGGEK